MDTLGRQNPECTWATCRKKGIFEIEEEIENTFNIDTDPDPVEAACDKLVSEGSVDVIPDNSGDKFYRKRSPLGEDDLSS